MRKVILYIAMSLDGYIADSSGKVDWLEGQDGKAMVDTYTAFAAGVDTVVMGWNTYHQIVTELSPGVWPYAGMTCYVVTHRDLPDAEGIRFVREDPRELLRRLKKEEGKDIWICGGAEVIHSLLRDRWIDEYRISVIPTILGSGISLFGTLTEEHRLRLVNRQEGNGIVELTYVPR